MRLYSRGEREERKSKKEMRKNNTKEALTCSRDRSTRAFYERFYPWKRCGGNRMAFCEMFWLFVNFDCAAAHFVSHSEVQVFTSVLEWRSCSRRSIRGRTRFYLEIEGRFVDLNSNPKTQYDLSRGSAKPYGFLLYSPSTHCLCVCYMSRTLSLHSPTLFCHLSTSERYGRRSNRHSRIVVRNTCTYDDL